MPLGPQIRIGVANTIASLPKPTVPMVSANGILSSQLYQFLYAIGNEVSDGQGALQFTTGSFASVGLASIGTPVNLCELILGAGAWLIFASATFTASVAGANTLYLGASSISATFPSAGKYSIQTTSPSTQNSLLIPIGLYTVASGTQDYWIVGAAVFSAGTMNATGMAVAVSIS